MKFLEERRPTGVVHGAPLPAACGTRTSTHARRGRAGGELEVEAVTYSTGGLLFSVRLQVRECGKAKNNNKRNPSLHERLSIRFVGFRSGRADSKVSNGYCVIFAKQQTTAIYIISVGCVVRAHPSRANVAAAARGAPDKTFNAAPGRARVCSSTSKRDSEVTVRLAGDDSSPAQRAQVGVLTANDFG
ncbi:hypothetical protein EVAR_5148_1 [Eumeta japonica]|uniref:Uncharacterized protein n=1 Tax=Eumeta variegata TaxID=151549 RepID=A0A4C1SX64_EUMVA|nr:hypothetical protein EVAR_5148_1 [Eumeta japonica]